MQLRNSVVHMTPTHDVPLRAVPLDLIEKPVKRAPVPASMLMPAVSPRFKAVPLRTDLICQREHELTWLNRAAGADTACQPFGQPAPFIPSPYTWNVPADAGSAAMLASAPARTSRRLESWAKRSPPSISKTKATGRILLPRKAKRPAFAGRLIAL